MPSLPVSVLVSIVNVTAPAVAPLLARLVVHVITATLARVRSAPMVTFRIFFMAAVPVFKTAAVLVDAALETVAAVPSLVAVQVTAASAVKMLSEAVSVTMPLLATVVFGVKVKTRLPPATPVV